MNCLAVTATAFGSLLATFATAQDMPPADRIQHVAPSAATPAPTQTALAHDMSAMDHSSMPGMDHGDMAGMDMSTPMTGAFGPYPMTRDASGTSWQPDASTHEGVHLVEGGWML